MIEFHDYDPSHPFSVPGEKHLIRDNKITLFYVPLKGSVTIEGFTEDTTGTLPPGTFYINYGDAEAYRTADQIIHFPAGYDGLAVTVDYKGVSTILRAEYMNEIKRFMEIGAAEIAARIIVLHEQAIEERMREWQENILTEIRGIKAAITQIAEEGCCPCPHRKDPFPEDTMDSGDIEEERQGDPVNYDAGDIEDESTKPDYANDAGEIILEGGKEPTAGESDASTDNAETVFVENSEESSVLCDGGEIAE